MQILRPNADVANTADLFNSTTLKGIALKKTISIENKISFWQMTYRLIINNNENLILKNAHRDYWIILLVFGNFQI